jgi:hypothetical protein
MSSLELCRIFERFAYFVVRPDPHVPLVVFSLFIKKVTNSIYMYDIKATLFLCSVFMFLLCKLVSTYVVDERFTCTGEFQALLFFFSDLPKAEY